MISLLYAEYLMLALGLPRTVSMPPVFAQASLHLPCSPCTSRLLLSSFEVERATGPELWLVQFGFVAEQGQKITAWRLPRLILCQVSIYDARWLYNPSPSQQSHRPIKPDRLAT